MEKPRQRGVEQFAQGYTAYKLLVWTWNLSISSLAPEPWSRAFMHDFLAQSLLGKPGKHRKHNISEHHPKQAQDDPVAQGTKQVHTNIPPVTGRTINTGCGAAWCVCSEGRCTWAEGSARPPRPPARAKSSALPQFLIHQFSSVRSSVVSDSLQPHEPQHARPPCRSTPTVHQKPRPLSRWCHKRGLMVTSEDSRRHSDRTHQSKYKKETNSLADIQAWQAQILPTCCFAKNHASLKKH